MEYEDPRKPTTLDDERLDARLTALFQSIAEPAPSPGFAARAMRAVKREPLPPGRKALRDPLVSLLGWSALIAGGGVMGLMLVLSQPQITAFFTGLISRGVGTGAWLIRFAGIVLTLSDVLATAGLAVSRAAATREGATGLVLVVVMAVLSLSALHRLLIAEREGSSWQELS